MGKRSGVPGPSEEEITPDEGLKEIIQKAWIEYHSPWNSPEVKEHYYKIIQSSYPSRY